MTDTPFRQCEFCRVKENDRWTVAECERCGCECCTECLWCLECVKSLCQECYEEYEQERE